ncbi:acetyl-CoA carboxylase biotin carboxyl carrier protein subunit [Nanoarchaeota archaeon]
MKIRIDSVVFDVKFYPKGDSFIAAIGDKKVQISKAEGIVSSLGSNTYQVSFGNEFFYTELLDMDNTKSPTIKAPIKGIVQTVNVKKGQTVTKGQNLIRIYSMKLQNDVNSEFAGKVVELNVKQGDIVEKGSVLLRLKR